MFITDPDLTTILDERQMTQVIAISESNRNRAENFAISEATAYLNFKFDTDAIFGFEAFTYNNTISYKEKQIIVDASATAYTCITDAPSGTALSDLNYFEIKDRRNPLIAMIIVDLLAYHLFSKIPYNSIPEHIKDRYKEAIAKLKNIRSGKMNPLLPIKQIDSDIDRDPNAKTSTITILSNPKRQNFY